ncbi:hypothetical protein, partial [Acinetobacter venetianus]|uniref:hypothetical protein n=1 Tax=Acinetobacter venetianus TaxID=52133 RepID=UPI000A583C7D
FITSDTQAFIVFATATPVNAVLAFESTAAKASSDGDRTVGAFFPTHLHIFFSFASLIHCSLIDSPPSTQQNHLYHDYTLFALQTQ